MINTEYKLEYTYSDRVTKNLKVKTKREILTAVKSSPELRKEISRVFHMANRRIENIEKADLISPAVLHLHKKSGHFTKFGMSGHSWDELKVEYSRALSFLNSPTSTARGAREFEKQSIAQLGINNDMWLGIREEFINRFNSMFDGILGKIPYAHLMQELYKQAEVLIGEQMENDSKKIIDNLEHAINLQAENIANTTIEEINRLLFGGKEL